MVQHPAFFTSFFTLPCRTMARSRSWSRPARTVATLRPNVAIIGGGFGGISTALRLASLPWTRLTRPQITLIDKSDRFAFLPMLYELATNEAESWEVAPPFVDLLQDTPIKFVRAEVDTIDTNNGVVEGMRIGGQTRESVQVPFDRALISIGAECANLDGVPGGSEFAFPFYSLPDALRLRERIRELMDMKQSDENINVFVVGGGYSGVELAACLSEKLGNRGSVVILERGNRLLKSAADHNRLTSEKVLEERGVMIEFETSVVQVSSDCIQLETRKNDEVVSESRPVDLVLWTAGSKPSSKLSFFDLPMDERNRVLTDDFLQVQGKEDLLFAVGDVASVSSSTYYSGTAQVAAQQAEYAAWNIWASLTDRSMLKYRYAHLGEMMVLGSSDATVTTTVGVEVAGLPAWTMRRAAYLARMPTDRHRMRVAASWAADPLLRGISKMATEVRRQGGVVN